MKQAGSSQYLTVVFGPYSKVPVELYVPEDRFAEGEQLLARFSL